jgi:uncharacterized protein (TIGR00255 family)
MTGFGKNQVELTNKLVTIEVKCLNSKQLDLNIRLPNLFRDKESELRSLVQQKLERGKVDFTVTIESRNEDASFTLNKPVLMNYYRQLKELARELPGESEANLLPLVLRMPDVMKPAKEEPQEEEWAKLLEAITLAIDKADGFRIQEGGILEEDIRLRITKIMELLEGVTAFEEGRISNLRKKITSQIAEMLGNVEFDKNRLEQEMIYYLEKLDVTEEKVRLQKHCEYFLETLKENDSNGKKMGFIAQEIGREINTLGSKANEVNIQKIVILMKDELEKVKEQLNNIL